VLKTGFDSMELLLSLCLGIGLSAACGFRIFVPLLGMSVAALAGHLTLASGFEWIGSWPALGCFLTATVLEVIAYYVPWLDNLLDSLATPAAVVAGIIVTAAAVSEISPLMQWSLAIIAGGGTAGAIQSSTVLLRGTSSATTGGFGNFLVATGELLLSLVMTLLALVLPILAAALVAFVAVYLLLRLSRRKHVRSAALP